MSRPFLTLAALGLCSLSPLLADDPKPAALPPAAAGTVEFARDIQPILAKNCFDCHNAAKQKGGLRLDDAKAALEGGNSGPAIVLGPKAAESRLLHAVAGLDPDLKMPPKGPALSAAD